MYKKRIESSLTVEAAIILPLFLYGLCIFLYFIHLTTAIEEINRAMVETVEQACQYAGLVKEENISIEKIALQGIFQLQLQREKLSGAPLLGGKNGVLLTGEEYDRENEKIFLKAEYLIKPPLPFFSFLIMRDERKVQGRVYSGRSYEKTGKKDTEKKEEEYVYVTETGTVFHTTLSCTYLKLSIQMVTIENILTLRNQSGGKYKPCESCAKKVEGSIVYITNTGDRYHTTTSCRGLKRTIKKIKKSEVEGRKPCSRCEIGKEEVYYQNNNRRIFISIRSNRHEKKGGSIMDAVTILHPYSCRESLSFRFIS